MIIHMLLLIKTFLTKLGIFPEEGQGLVEYVLIFLLVVIVVIGGLTFFGEELNALYIRIVADLPFG